ncbi:MAG: RNA polymerase sigma factor [Dehalococcoidia bacterium]
MTRAQPADSGMADADQVRLLVEALRARDETAWSQLYDQNFHPLYLYSLARVHDRGAAEEIASQVFEEALRGIKGFQYRGVSLRAWLYGIARNVTADHIRKRARRPESQLFDYPAALDEMRAAGIRTDFISALQNLTEEQQQVVILRFVQDLTVADTAHVVGKSEGAVKMLQLRALEKLRDEMSR